MTDATIRGIVDDPALGRDAKVRRLVELARDARAAEVASGEGMPSARASGLQRIHAALRELGAADAIEDVE